VRGLILVALPSVALIAACGSAPAPDEGSATICSGDRSTCAAFAFGHDVGREPVAVFTPPFPTMHVTVATAELNTGAGTGLDRPAGCGDRRGRCTIRFQLARRVDDAKTRALLPHAARAARLSIDGRAVGTEPAAAWTIRTATAGSDIAVPAATIDAEFALPRSFGRHTLAASITDDSGRRVESEVSVVLVRPPRVAVLPAQSGELLVRVDRLHEETSFALRRVFLPPIIRPAPPYRLALEVGSRTYDRRALRKPLDTVTLRARLAPGRYDVHVALGPRVVRLSARVR
jgi:hypothetical protein